MQRLKTSLAQKAAPKRPEWPSYNNFRNVTQDPHFLKKIAQKVAIVWKAQKHTGASGIILSFVRYESANTGKLLAQTAAPKGPEWPSYSKFFEVIQNPHFLKKCKGGTKGNFSKIAQKVALVWKA